MKGLSELKLLGQGLILQTPSLLPHEATCICLSVHKIQESEMFTYQNSTFSNLGEKLHNISM